MRKPILLLLLLLAGFASKATILLSQGFEGTTFPPTIPAAWNVVTPSTNVNYASQPTGWVRQTGAFSVGYPTTVTPHTGIGMAGFNNWEIASGGTSTLSTPGVVLPATGTNVLSYWLFGTYSGFYNDRIDVYVGTSSSISSATLVATHYPNNTSTPTQWNGWRNFTYTFPTSGTYYVFFLATSQFGYDVYLDDISIVNLTPCSSPISAGKAFSTPNPVCGSIPFTIDDTAYTASATARYYWQSSPAGLNTWTTITAATPGALSAAYTVPGITTATDYRFIDSCTTGNTHDTSNVIHVTLNNYLNCYCIPVHSNGGCTTGYDINSVLLTGVLGTAIVDTANPCPSGASTTNPSYTISTAMSATLYAPSNNFLYLNSSYGPYPYMYAGVYIDLNDDGNFNTTPHTATNCGGEYFPYSGGLATYPAYSQIPINIQACANPGCHRMRVRDGYFFTSPTPCLTATYGETRDYTVCILPQTPPVPTVTTNSPLCPYTTLSMTACTNPSYPSPTFTFYGPDSRLPITIPGNSSSCATLNLPGVGPNLTNYSVTVTASGYTSNPATPTIVIYKVPALTVSNVTATTSCTSANGSVTLNGLDSSVTYTLRYRFNGVDSTPKTIKSTATNPGTYVWSGLRPGMYDSIRVITSQGCRSNIVVVPFTITTPTPPATPTPISNSPLCAGDTLKLNVTNTLNGGQYIWLGPTGFRATVSNPIRTLINFPDSGNYYVAVANSAGCVSAQALTNVKLSVPGPAPTPNNVTYCQFDVAQPLTANGQSLLYYDSLNQQLKTGTITKIPSTSVAGTFIYYVTQTTGGACESPRTPLTVIIKPQPPTPAIPNTTIQLCQYEPTSALSVSGTAVRWYNTPTGGTSSVTAPTPVTLVPGTFFYYSTQTINGCESQRLKLTVIVKPKPEPPSVVSPLNLCQFDPIQPVTAVGQSLLWYTVPNGGVGVPVAPLPNTGYEDSFKYWVTQTVNSCQSDRALINVIVNYKPNGILTASTASVCQDAIDSFYYYGNARPDAQFVWFSPLTTTVLSGVGTPGPYVVKFDTFGTTIIRLTINNKGCISSLLSAPITVRPLPVISFVKRQDVCRDEMLVISLNAVSTNPVITGFGWDFNASNPNLPNPAIVYGDITTGGPFGVKYSQEGHYQIAATATAGGCTSDPIYQDVYVHELPDATITADQPDLTNVCSSDTIRLSVPQVSEGATYSWTPAAFFQNYRDSLNHIVDAVVSQSAEIKVNIKTSYGCAATDSIKIMTQPCCGVYFPNAFTPNGDGKNDLFRPITKGSHRVNSFKIVNRWGQVVYESKIERNGWDGSVNGVPQDMGTYFYFISYQCEGKPVEEHGEFLLVR